mgnify:CR=1 FL=1
MTLLAPYACHPAASRGRLHAEPGGEMRGPRDVFQRDRDRIIHSIAFRRLRHKTQVFVSPDGDHYRVRLTHSLEVAQIGRTTARTLGLNEDLTEALCLAHDIGHPPFGHAGEDALEAALDQHGGFDHNAHTLRTLMLLESPYPRFRGLNLSWEMLEGLAKHNGPVDRPGWAMRELDAMFPLDLASHASLEAQLAAISDDIAYDNHDIDDGLRAGLLTLEQLLEVPFVRACWDRVRARYPDVAQDRLLRELGELLLLNLRRQDLLCRYAGDRFAVVLPATERTVAEKLRGELEQATHSFAFKTRRGETHAVTVHSGLAVSHDDDADSLIERANCSLSQAIRRTHRAA